MATSLPCSGVPNAHVLSRVPIQTLIGSFVSYTSSHHESAWKPIIGSSIGPKFDIWLANRWGEVIDLRGGYVSGTLLLQYRDEDDRKEGLSSNIFL